jgi:signal transduction histidine kinase
VPVSSVVCRIGERYRFSWVVAAGVIAVSLLLGAAPSDAQPVVRQLLVLQRVDRGNLSIDQFTGHFRVELDKRTETPVNVVQVVLSPTGFGDVAEQAVVDYIRSIFIDRAKPDLIMTITGPAAAFARKHRQQIFPGVPLLFASLDRRFLANAPLGDNEIALTVDNDFPRIVDDIVELLPQTREVFVVIGSGQLAQYWRRELEGEFGRFHERLKFAWLDDLSFPEILRRCASLPDNSAILYVTFGTDAAGASYADDRVLAELRTVANAPLFAAHSVFMGAGIVGGSLLSIEDLGRRTAEIAAELLNGAAPKSINVPPRPPLQQIFDWRELQRWGVPESRLPPGSVVRYRSPSLWNAYRGAVLSAAGVLAVQSLLIVGLLYQRRARQRAERDSRRNLALAADATRRQTISALTSSIGHEVGQPLGAILYNAQALQEMVAANRATPDTIGEIMSDIQTQGVRATQIIERHRTMLKSHELDRRPIDLRGVIDETVALLAHDMAAREVSASVVHASSPCIVDGAQVLLQQVLVNLVMNAMDAMADTPPERRSVTISTQHRAADIDVSVSDTGPGVPTQILDNLFAPFVTTKARGLGIGLTIVRSIVDAHDGTIVAHNHSGGGATFTVTLRRSAAAPARDAVH